MSTDSKYTVDDTDDTDDREVFEVAIVVMVNVKGVDKHDAEQRGRTAVTGALAAMSSDPDSGEIQLDSVKFEGFRRIPRGHRILARIAAVETLGSALYQQFIRMETTGRASRYMDV